MRRVIVIAVAGASLAGCSSFSLDAFKPTPPTLQVQLDSVPPGADARTSLGPGCKTPCSVAVAPPDSGFSVTYTLNKFQPATVPVQVIHTPGDFTTPASTTIDPNPVVAELQPAGPPILNYITQDIGHLQRHTQFDGVGDGLRTAEADDVGRHQSHRRGNPVRISGRFVEDCVAVLAQVPSHPLE